MYAYLNSILGNGLVTRVGSHSERPCDYNMKTVYFTVRTDSDDREYQDCKCEVELPQSKADAIDCMSDYFDEDEYNRFCDREVYRIMKEQHPEAELHYNWYFRDSPSCDRY